MKSGNGRENMARADECGRIAALLPALPDGDLDAEAAARVKAHLEGCRTCAVEARAYLGMGGLLRVEPCPRALLPSGSEVVTRILEKEAGRAGAQRRWPAVLAPAAVAASAAAILVFTQPPPPRDRRVPAPSHVAAPGADPLPALVVVDDEETGRMVQLAPPLPLKGSLRAP
jgi:anti-sigma factor RsiW